MAKGEISILRVSGSDQMRIELQDELSRVRFLVVSIDAQSLMMALTGLGGIDCEFELMYTDTVGKRLETKEEIVTLSKSSYSLRTVQKLAALSNFEVDGWKARASDLDNHHHFVKQAEDGSYQYRVHFSRFVEVSE